MDEGQAVRPTSDDQSETVQARWRRLRDLTFTHASRGRWPIANSHAAALISGPLCPMDNLIGVAPSMFWQSYCTATSVAALDQADASSRFVPASVPSIPSARATALAAPGVLTLRASTARAEVYPIH